MSGDQTKDNEKTTEQRVASEDTDEPRIFVAICR
jgi:hypothetical protein